MIRSLMSCVISIENVSKSYRLGVIGSGTLREDLQSWWHRKRGLPDPNLRVDQAHLAVDGQTLWALHDISLEVEQGEVLGIIGRNGAGKSTLLKILSRVTAPTSGRIRVKGRVASLLEVGTGFHPELTGRENVFLNGAILGMTKAEVARKFDEIVAFSEIEQFIDTPVKRYSSGMYVRLAFAVAAHMDPEILVVDEVLAVGDAAFQKKCLGKMNDVADEGRTVLFVSHNMNMITRLCKKSILLKDGKIIQEGRTEEIVKYYLNPESISPAERIWKDIDSAPGDAVAKLHSVRICDADGRILEKVDIEKPFFVEIEYWNLQTELKPTAILHFINQMGTVLFATNDWNDENWWNKPSEPGRVRSRCLVPGNLLAEGVHSILAAIGTYNPNVIHALESDVVSFVVVDDNDKNSVRRDYAGGNWPGVMRPFLSWSVTLNKGN